jgi:hypothetical protein
VCHPRGNSETSVSDGIYEFFSSGDEDVMKPETPKVTRKGTEATNCRYATWFIKSNSLVGLEGSWMKAGFRAVENDKQMRKPGLKTGMGSCVRPKRRGSKGHDDLPISY